MNTTKRAWPTYLVVATMVTAVVVAQTAKHGEQQTDPDSRSAAPPPKAAHGPVSRLVSPSGTIALTRVGTNMSLAGGTRYALRDAHTDYVRTTYDLPYDIWAGE